MIPGLAVHKIKYIDGSNFNAVLGSYHIVFYAVLLGILAFLLLMVILKNWINQLIKFLLLSFLVDIVLHIVIGLGAKEAYIFAGNYSFIFPIIIGIGYQNAMSKSKSYARIYLTVFSLIFLVFTFKNIISLFSLYNFGCLFYSN